MDPIPSDPYQDVALGVECAWPVPAALATLREFETSAPCKPLFDPVTAAFPGSR